MPRHFFCLKKKRGKVFKPCHAYKAQLYSERTRVRRNGRLIVAQQLVTTNPKLQTTN